MAGIYIHIPYCKQACHYCDFHFSVKMDSKEKMVAALLKEIELQRNYLQGENVNTIYFGGGTPSLLSRRELDFIFEKLFATFSVEAEAEITLEANPDDLTREKIQELKSSPVNRLSIGVQSFSNEDLNWMNRVHNSVQAIESVKHSQDAGFENITIDLIYGIPESPMNEWQKNVEQALALNVQHLSCYSLTVEQRTALAHFISTGKSKPVNEEQSASQFEWLMKRMGEQSWLHYEISNFALNEKFISQHNSAYWKSEKYLGLGPSAHSFNGTSRQWNISDNYGYVNSIAIERIPFEKEELTEVQRINERIMTELRTMWGIQIANLDLRIANWIKQQSQPFVSGGFLEFENGFLILTNKGKLIADKIILELMKED